MVFVGPIRPGTSVAVFRATGRSVPRRSGGIFSGPVRRGRDEEIFRSTGKSVITGSAEATRLREEIARKAREEVARAAKEVARVAKEAADRKRLAELNRISRDRKRNLTIRQRSERDKLRRAEGRRAAESFRALSSIQRKKLLDESRVRLLERQRGKGVKLSPRLEAARQRIKKAERERIFGKEGLTPKQQLELAAQEAREALFIEERVVDTFRRGGKEIPVIKIIIVDSKGRKVRDATAEEKRMVREVGQALRIPEELKVGEGKVLADIEREATRLRQKRLRGKEDVKGELALAGLTVAGTLIGTGLAITQLPKLPAATVKALKRFIKDPKVIKEIPEAIARGGAEFGYLARISPTEAFVRIGTEYFIMKGTGKALKITGKLTSRVATKVSSSLKGVKVTKRAISIPSLQKGKALTIRVSQKLGRGRIPDQLKFAGKRTTAVSAQADRLVNFIKKRKIIRKPIRGEETLTKATKKLLKKFDDGKITAKELVDLDRRISVEAKKGLLERSFFADPEGVVRKRFLRLGTEKEASLLDTLAGDVTFKTSKPQILVFKDVKVQAFPKTKTFQSITKKLKSGRALTEREAGKLLEFQLKKTGKFKPLGFQTTEMEITLSPGEIIKKQKTIAHVLIDKKRVAIVQVKVVKAKSTTKKLLAKADKGKITASELKTLRKNLKKETGFTSSISDSRISRPRLPLGRKSISVAIRPRRRAPKRKPVRRPPVRRPVKKPSRRAPKRKVVRRPLKKVPKRIPKEVVRRRPPAKGVRRKVPSKPRPKKPIARPPVALPTKKVRVKPKKKKAPQAYKVSARPLKKKGQKKKPKLVKVSDVPLSKGKAKDLRNLIADTSLARTAQISKTRGKPGKSRLNIPTGYASRTKPKFRTYRIVKGKRIPLKKGRVIERRGRLLDTPQERQGITVRRRISQLQKKPTPKKRISAKRITKTTKRKLSSAQSEALAKGRKIRMENLKKRKEGKK